MKKWRGGSWRPSAAASCERGLWHVVEKAERIDFYVVNWSVCIYCMKCRSYDSLSSRPANHADAGVVPPCKGPVLHEAIVSASCSASKVKICSESRHAGEVDRCGNGHASHASSPPRACVFPWLPERKNKQMNALPDRTRTRTDRRTERQKRKIGRRRPSLSTRREYAHGNVAGSGLDLPAR